MHDLMRLRRSLQAGGGTLAVATQFMILVDSYAASIGGQREAQCWRSA